MRLYVVHHVAHLARLDVATQAAQKLVRPARFLVYHKGLREAHVAGVGAKSISDAALHDRLSERSLPLFALIRLYAYIGRAGHLGGAHIRAHGHGSCELRQLSEMRLELCVHRWHDSRLGGSRVHLLAQDLGQFGLLVASKLLRKELQRLERRRRVNRSPLDGAATLTQQLVQRRLVLVGACSRGVCRSACNAHALGSS